MKLDAELLHRLVALRLHLAGVGRPPAGVEGNDAAIDFPFDGSGSRLRLDTSMQSAEILVADVEGYPRPLGSVPDLSDPGQFASILHNVDCEMARSHEQVTLSLVALADALALCDDEEVSALVDDVISREEVEVLSFDRTVTDVFVEFARLVEQSNVDEMCVLTWEVLTRKAGAIPAFDHAASLMARSDTARAVAARVDERASWRP